MKKYTTVALIILGILPLMSVSGPDEFVQNDAIYECLYKYTINGDVQETYNTILQIGRYQTRFYDYTSYSVDSLSFAKDASSEEKERLSGLRYTSRFYFDSEVFQNIPSGKMTILQEAFPDKFSYEEDLGAFEWKLESATDTICGYACSKAVTYYGGREWVAWFSPEIPYSAGPWKFNGLPGLILAVKDTEGIHGFESIIFRKGITPISYQEDSKVHKSTRANVLKAKLRAEHNVEAGIKPDKSQVWDYLIVMNLAGDKLEYYNGIGMRSHPAGYIPIELE